MKDLSLCSKAWKMLYSWGGCLQQLKCQWSLDFVCVTWTLTIRYILYYYIYNIYIIYILVLSIASAFIHQSLIVERSITKCFFPCSSQQQLFNWSSYSTDSKTSSSLRGPECIYHLDKKIQHKKWCKAYITSFQESIWVDEDMAVPKKNIWASCLQNVFQSILVDLRFQALSELL